MRRSLLSAVPGLLWAVLAPAAALGAQAPAFRPQATRAWFDEAMRQCQADGGRLWGKSLCGPMLVVEPATRRVIASQADAQGKLTAEQGVFVGRLPPTETLANTPLTWAGVRWSELLWPLPEDAPSRRTLMAHEAFHRIQDSLGLASGDGDNAHLDTVDGRYTLQLEWRALDAALTAHTDADRRARIADALTLRTARHRRFPTARAAETALERNEGLAEYTGVVVGNTAPADRLAVARRDLTRLVGEASFVRSFAYATGPAYGLLLDRYRPGWRKAILHGGSPAELLASALHLDLAATPRIEARAARYGGPALLASERVRAQDRARKAAAYRAQLVTGPVLRLPLAHMKVQFNPTNLMPLGEAGTVYPTMQVIDDWGSIQVDGGALMARDWKRLTVAAPDGKVRSGTLRGKGWTLQLAPGWRLLPGTRNGDRTVGRSEAPAKTP
jgi:hypothetical protein